jgi:hypothetical protein
MTPPEKDDKKALRPRGRLRVPVDYPALFTGDAGSGHGLEFVRFEGRTKEQLEDMLNQREVPAED